MSKAQINPFTVTAVLVVWLSNGTIEISNHPVDVCRDIVRQAKDADIQISVEGVRIIDALCIDPTNRDALSGAQEQGAIPNEAVLSEDDPESAPPADADFTAPAETDRDNQR